MNELTPMLKMQDSYRQNVDIEQLALLERRTNGPTME
jgi:hypothetical protein